ncbi:MAG: FAD-dependent oxidoreductase, partial [Ignavibacteria bacterium]
MNIKNFDAIVVGSGQAGNPLARALAGEGWKVAVIERRYAGGTCINYGCTPTKTMISSARVAYLASRGKEFGVHTEKIKVNLREVKKRKDRIVLRFREGVR